MDDKIITFESYHDPMLAHIIRTKLEAAGIPCFIEQDSMSGLNPVYNQAVSGLKLKVLVFERDLEKCHEVLAEDNSIDPEEHLEIDPETLDAIICPFCESTNVVRIESEERPDWLNTLYRFFAAVIPFYDPKRWHCNNCKQDFE
jgi:hypothetical protein